MELEERLKTIEENVPKVFEAGKLAGAEELEDTDLALDAIIAEQERIIAEQQAILDVQAELLGGGDE